MINPIIKIDDAFCLLAQLLIWIYQHLLSPLMRFFTIAPSPCRYHPTCSQYALECFRTHRFTIALTLSIRRFFRCHPLAEGGYDPVPPPKK